MYKLGLFEVQYEYNSYVLPVFSNLPKASDFIILPLILFQLDLFTRYVSTRPSFHGLCLLKYTVFTPSPGARYSPRDIVPIATGTAAGTLAVVIFPSFGEINAKMTGKSFIDIKEDEVNPPCVKVSNPIFFNVNFKILQYRDGPRPSKLDSDINKRDAH